MKKIFTLFVSLAVVFVFLGFLPIHGEAEIYDNTIRLHVIANSDTKEDQALKLKVRDCIIEKVKELFLDKDVSDIDTAKSIIESDLQILANEAENCVINEGFEYPVSIDMSEENYPTKNYEDIAFPSGKYLSLQLKIGNAEGENWWCVLFPPLCLSAASEYNEDILLDLGFTGEQYKVITQKDNVKYNVRFKILETVEKAFE